ncbi:MAG TPA: hypothetical protein VFW94_04625 [Candidatus Acidoferrales bacterium]|nr:hypothetical protein [Candidatus Acidoferrales bacterium]
MNFVVIGTDHRFQDRDPGLDGILRAFLDQRWTEPLTAIAEEFGELTGCTSLAKRLASERNLRWYNLDMTTQEKQDAGILQEQRSRPGMFQAAVAYRVPSDNVREDAWVEKLIASAAGTTLVICGYLHFEALVEKLTAKGHDVDRRAYLETVPSIKRPAEDL